MENKLIENLLEIWESIREEKLFVRSFKHHKILELINNLMALDNIFKVIRLGKSFEGRDIFNITIGEGKINIALWSQMHGDEATATAAFFDIFNFFKKEDLKTELLILKEKLLSELSLSFIPMLNPDGAERFVRENAMGIDLNRDAKDLLAPESKILNEFINNFKPEYAFNMHDQDYLWSVGNSKKVAALSFLAPPFDEQKSLNLKRKRAINLISNLYNNFNQLVDFRITKYSDEFEPRAFGDTIAGKGVSTILIESGLWKGDQNKLYLRKMNFAILLYAFYLIANNDIKDDLETYDKIPFNGEILEELN